MKAADIRQMTDDQVKDEIERLLDNSTPDIIA